MHNHRPARFRAKAAGIACCTLSLLLATPAVSLADPTGEWVVAEGYARIRVFNCNDQMWGVVSWEARPEVDKNNPDPSKRARPTLGMPILLGMKPAGDNRWEGEIYNSQDGRTYSASISVPSLDVLRVRGCVLGFLCGGESWSRAKLPNQSVGSARPSANAAWIPGGTTKVSSAPAAQLCAGLVRSR